MTPKDNELRMQIGLVVTHTDDELLFVRSEKNPNTLDALQAFADLVRQDERASCAKLLDDFTKTEMVPVKDTWRMGVMAAANAVRDKK